MTYKTILSVLTCAADVEATISAALKLPAGRDIHLIGCHGEPSQFVVMAAPVDVPDAATVTALHEEADQRMAELGALFTNACVREGISYEWRPIRSAGGDSANSALTLARTVDLVIARQPDLRKEDVPNTNFEALLYEGGRPLLMLGADGQLADQAKRILVAWNGSREACRAVHDALPFLQAAEDVHILIVDPDKLSGIDQATPGHDLAASLDRHGINAILDVTECGSRSVTETIGAHAADIGADMLVMGAYTHLKVREWLFGGVTREILNKVPVATLLSR